jgi:hypothetical protein
MRPASIGNIFTISFISFQCSAAFPLPSAHFTLTLPPTAASNAITQQHQHRHTTTAASASWGINAANTCSSSRYTSALHVKNPNRIMIQYTPAALQHLAAVELPPTYSQPWTMEKTIAISGALLIAMVVSGFVVCLLQEQLYTFFLMAFHTYIISCSCVHDVCDFLMIACI